MYIQAFLNEINAADKKLRIIPSTVEEFVDIASFNEVWIIYLFKKICIHIDFWNTSPMSFLISSNKYIVQYFFGNIVRNKTYVMLNILYEN